MAAPKKIQMVKEEIATLVEIESLIGDCLYMVNEDGYVSPLKFTNGKAKVSNSVAQRLRSEGLIK